MTHRIHSRRCALLAASLFITSSAHAASVQTFVIAVGGQSQLGPNFKCATFGPATTGLNFFGNVSVGVPTDGLATCGVAGGFRTTTAAAGPISDTTSVSATFNTLPANTATADASANAVSGKVGASAHASFTGPMNGMIVEGASSYGLYTETLTLSSPNVVAATPGTVRLAFTIDGSMAVTGPANAGMADVEVNYQLGNGPDYHLVRAQINGSAGTPFVAVGTGAPATGFVAGPGALSGIATIESFELPIDWSVPTELTFGILASTIPSSNGTASVDFLSSVKLTGIIASANGQPITDFAVTTGSGAVYTAQGVQLAAVPVPAAWMLIASTLGMLARRRRGSRIS